MDANYQRKKRKLMHTIIEEEEEEEETESEDAKMEKFYELISISKEIRARMMIINGERLKQEEERMKKKSKGINESDQRGAAGGAWIPTFQLEDFMEDGHGLQVSPSSRININGTTAAAASASKKEDEADDDDKGGGADLNGMDLSLSL